MKYIIVTGGVVSGLGKGITASSVGLLLKNIGYSVTMIKIDPYLNIDAGTMSPYEHGEVFVLEDGSETDLDLGNYERFLDIKLTNKHNITSGKIFNSVIEDERKGKYLGKTVQIIPHVTDKIKSVIIETSKIPVSDTAVIPDICIIELGGTVGDIESMHFLEAIRQLSFENVDDTFCFIHVSLVLKIFPEGEFKTKPTQNSVKELRKIGISPDIIVIRCSENIDDKTRHKLRLFCQVPLENIIINNNARTIYHVPLIFNEQNILQIICRKLNISSTNYEEIDGGLPLRNIQRMVSFYESDNTKSIDIVIIGKYTGLSDSYISIIRTLEHASLSNNCKVNIKWLSAELFENGLNCPDLDIIKQCSGVIIPGGFGVRGIEGMINIASYCRKNDIPVLGICLGMHIMCIEATRNTLKESNSTEFDPGTPYPIVISIRDLNNTQMGGTMKLGLKSTILNNSSYKIFHQVYNRKTIIERHRHRYEINPGYIKNIENDSLKFVGTNITNSCMDIVEDSNHIFYIGCQFHPEFQSSISQPAPLFDKFVQICSITSNLRQL